MSVLSDVSAIQRRIDELNGPFSPPPRDTVIVSPAFAPTRVEPPAARAAFQALIHQNSARSGVDPALVEAVISRESAFDPHARSAVGAEGLMQLMPQTAGALGVSDPFDPAQNVRGGTRYLRSLLDRFGGDVSLAVAAYNAGPSAVERYNGVPPYAETQAYVREVLATYHALREHH
jgi:soluble lytic murein transglycosylase-like protein